MSRLTGKSAVVTGASRGIGAAIAKALAAEGASVVVNYASSKADADAVVGEIEAAGGVAVAAQADVSKGEQAKALIAAAIARFGRLDILVNNAGVYQFAPAEAIDEDHYGRIFNLNVLGVLQTTAAAIPHLPEGGSVINIGSTISTMLMPNTAAYSASKAAVDAITVVTAKELGSRKIRVNTLAPGMVLTENNKMPDEQVQAISAMTPLGRPGEAEEIAAVAVFLASDDSRWVTADRIVASGGLQ